MSPILLAAFITAAATVLSSLITRYSNERKWKRKVASLAVECQRRIPEAQLENIFRIPEENDLREKRMQQILLERTSSLRLLARSGFSYLHHQGPNWKNKTSQESEEGGIRWLLEQDIPMTVVLEDPYSDSGKCRRRADDDSKPWRDVSWERIEEIKKRYTKLDILFTGVPILCSLFFTDSSVMYDPYHLGKLPKIETSKNHFLVFEFAKPRQSVDHNYYAQLECHFNFILADRLTIPLQKFIEKYREYLR